MDKSKIRLLVVDDERACAPGCRRRCAARATRSTPPTTRARGSELIRARLFSLVLTDVRMPGMTGMELFREARQRSRDTQFILMTWPTAPSRARSRR